MWRANILVTGWTYRIVTCMWTCWQFNGVVIIAVEYLVEETVSHKERSVIIVLAICLVATSYFIGYGQTENNSQKDDKNNGNKNSEVVATINGHRVITQKEVDDLIGVRLYDLQQKVYFLRDVALNNLITKVLLEEEAKARGITVDDLKRQLVPSKVDIKLDKVDEVYNEHADMFANMSEDEARQRVKLDLESHEKMTRYKSSLDEIRRRAKVNIYLSEPSSPIVRLGNEGPAKGPSSALVTIIEFSDFQCSYCKQTVPTLNKLMHLYSGDVRLVFKHLPLPNHPQAFVAAQASVCAERQGKFWEYHDHLFDYSDDLSADKLKKIASETSLKADEFNSCLGSEESRTVVLQDIQAAKKYGIQGTPTLIINGKIIKGGNSIENLRKVVDEEIKKKKE